MLLTVIPTNTTERESWSPVSDIKHHQNEPTTCFEPQVQYDLCFNTKCIEPLCGFSTKVRTKAVV